MNNFIEKQSLINTTVEWNESRQHTKELVIKYTECVLCISKENKVE